MRLLRWAALGVLVLVAGGTMIGVRGTSQERRETEVIETAGRFVDALMSGNEVLAASVLCAGVSGPPLSEPPGGYHLGDVRVDGDSASVSYRVGPFHRDGRWQTYPQLDLRLDASGHGWCIAVPPELRAS
jgi:hypothetical protein